MKFLSRGSGSRTKMVRNAGLAVALLGLTLAPGAASAASCANEKPALTAGAAFIKAAKSRSASAFSNALKTHTNLSSIALFALGKHRKDLPASKKAEFVNLTGDYIARTLAEFSLKFRANEIKRVNCRGAIVETKLLQLGGRPAAKVLWRFKGGKVADVNVQNVWLAQLLRSNFSNVIKKGGGFDALWSKLAQK